jgi:hypothetical protein
VEGVVHRVPWRWWSVARTVSFLAAVAVTASCSLDRTPELSGERRRGVPVIPTRSASSSTGLGPNVSNIPMTDAQRPGAHCGGMDCSFTLPSVVSCCTTQTDVDRHAARQVDRCGEKHSATGDPRYGSACWQRDQLGFNDPRCQVSAPDEVGCCSDGSCGTNTARDKLGCRYALDEAPFPCEQKPDEPPVTGGPPAIECDPLGVFGVIARVDVSWGGRSGGLVGITDDGRGPILVYLLVHVEGVDANKELRGTIKPCGVELPPFYSTTLCESYNPIFPRAMWESPTMPVFPLFGRYSCYGPGCSLTLDAQTTLLGIELMEREAPWPTPAQTGKLQCPLGNGQQCFPDHDSDQLPGLSIDLNTMGQPAAGVGCNGDYIYEAAPLNADPTVIFKQVRRAETVLIGVRNKLGGSAQISADCNSGAGNGVAEFFQSRAYGCIVKEGTANLGAQPAGPDEACDGNEAQFMDENLPIYYVLGAGETPAQNLMITNKSPSTGTQFGFVRLGKLGEPMSCADVRAAPYP